MRSPRTRTRADIFRARPYSSLQWQRAGRRVVPTVPDTPRHLPLASGARTWDLELQCTYNAAPAPITPHGRRRGVCGALGCPTCHAPLRAPAYQWPVARAPSLPKRGGHHTAPTAALLLDSRLAPNAASHPRGSFSQVVHEEVGPLEISRRERQSMYISHVH